MSLKESFETIGLQFQAKFREQLRGPRMVGREAEYTVIKNDGTAANIFELFEPLQATGSFKLLYDNPPNEKMLVGLESKAASYSSEVGLGTIEVITGPANTLFELKEMHEKAMRPLLKICKERNLHVLGFGIQPITKASPQLMSPKQRYKLLLDIMGPSWLWFCVTSSDQAQIDITRDEIVKFTNFGILMAPVVIALCGNSSVCGDNQDYICHREGLKKSIFPGEQRHGMIERPYDDLGDFIERLSKKTCLLLKDKSYYAVNKPFVEVLKEKGPDLETFLMHDHYLWNSARARSAHSTVEIRPACQQPWSEHMSVAALSLGLVEAEKDIQAYLNLQFGNQTWPLLNDYHKEAVRFGLAAKRPVPGFLLEILSLAYKGLVARGFKEEELLKPLFERLKAEENPGQKAKKIFEAKGIKAMIDSLKIV